MRPMRPAMPQRVVRRGDAIRVFARNASGDVAPTRSVTGAATNLNGVFGLAVDAARNELIAVSADVNAIMFFSRTASGNVAPLRTVTGAATGLVTPVRVILR
jgi:hypothetical protein